jgi:UDP-N-acetylmuramoyl-L-alanyl-D-glutamate--2,6-diaminopimelate ligase
MRLGDLCEGVSILEKIHWNPSRNFGKITSDSRLIEPDDIFVATHGARMDGHDFLGQAILAKASVIVYEQMPDELFIPKPVTAVRVKDTHQAFALLLNQFYKHPDRKVRLTGVTGTNGKTTVAYLLHKLLREKTTAAYLGTLWYELPRQKMEASNTTPGAEVLIPLLHEMIQEKIENCVMEVSSHALHQGRVYGLQFELAVFTQLTQDHLDYHKTMEHYFQAKRLFFSASPRPKQILINKDCPFGRRLLEENPKASSFSLNPGSADYQALKIEPSFQGSRFYFKYRGCEALFQIRLPMRHNVANVVTVLSALDMLGYNPEDFKGILQEIPGIPGRLERVLGAEDFQVFVDYAHTPDAVENVLREARLLKPHRILTLIGCGGDRDKTKRPLMGKIAAEYSDRRRRRRGPTGWC